MAPQPQQSQSDEQYNGYYYDAEAGNIATITVTNGTVELYAVDESEPYYTYDDVEAFEPEEESLQHVPGFAVNNPIAVAEAVYRNGYQQEDYVTVNGNTYSIPAIEFANAVTEFTVTDRLTEQNR
jgi:hypothetical protein